MSWLVKPKLLRELADLARLEAAAHDDDASPEADRLYRLAARLDAEADREDLVAHGKRCGCGAVYDEAAWRELPYGGIQAMAPGEGIELRHCTRCRSTLGICVLTAADAA
jgi:hypothetical protein